MNAKRFFSIIILFILYFISLLNTQAYNKIKSRDLIANILLELNCQNISDSINLYAYDEKSMWHQYTINKYNHISNISPNYIKAIKLKLSSKILKEYDIFYRAKIENYGWLDWGRNGDIVGTTNISDNIQCIQIKLISREQIPNLETSNHNYSAIIDTSNEKIEKTGGCRSRVIAIGEGENKKFFKAPETKISSSNLKAWNMVGVPTEGFVDSKIRNVATTRLAQLFGIEHLIAHSQSVKVKINSKYIKGILMDAAPGSDFYSFKEISNKAIAPSFQKSLCSLELFDAICAQADRVPWNYSILYSNSGEALDLVAYDNDLSFGLKTNLKDFSLCDSFIIDNHGRLSLPYLDQDLAKRVLQVTNNHIENALYNLLPKEYITATQKRLMAIKKAINHTILLNKNFTISNHKWNKKTIDEELSLKKFTYLKFFYHCLNR